MFYIITVNYFLCIHKYILWQKSGLKLIVLYHHHVHYYHYYNYCYYY